jgi:hypothetical protein
MRKSIHHNYLHFAVLIFGTVVHGCNAAIPEQQPPEATLEASEISEAEEPINSEQLLGLQIASSCNGSSTCPAENGSCAGWSSYSECGEPTCTYRHCWYCFDEAEGQASSPNGYGTQAPPDCVRIPAAFDQPTERYRVCFDSGGNSCVEFQQSYYLLGCDC